MSTKLPITINASHDLMSEYALSKVFLERLEAWANFETLKANWYGDESLQLNCKFTLVTQPFFEQTFSQKPPENWDVDHEQYWALNVSANVQKSNIFLAIGDQLSALRNQVDQQTGMWNDSELQRALQVKVRSLLNILAEKLALDKLSE